MRLDRERTKLEKSSDQEENKDKAEKSEQFDHEEVSQVQGVKLSTTMVKVQHELIVQSVETNQKEEVEYGKKKRSKSLNDYEFQGSYLERIKFCNLEIYEKKQVVDFVFGYSAFWNTEIKAQTWLFERGRGFQIFWSFKKEKFVEFCYKKTYQNELQNQDSCSLQFKKSKVGTRAQGIHPLIDKNLESEKEILGITSTFSTTSTTT
ncbi:hypothetical protein F2Q69_00016618 [Brassica cretica]|uniref:Uncharacterized protein n=1 Tax=Brassica cretica TaxID=69181 RepID=A0A8S9QJZ1_BRACR|nr:hypothetical protein F2Q69_00016618 [Brassica cretica]